MNPVRNTLGLGCVVLSVIGAALMVRPAEPARAGDARVDFTKVRFYTRGELYAVQQSVFETLFLQPWEEEHWEYRLDAPFVGEGIYSGTNQYAQVFDLSVRFQGLVDLKQVALSPEQRQWAMDNHFAIAGVIGELRHGEARIGVHGLVVTTRDAGGLDRSRFWLTNTCEIVEEEPEPQGIEAESGSFKPRSDAKTRGGGVPADACHDGCAATRNQRIDRANRDYDLQVATAAQVRDIARNNARAAYTAAVNSAKTGLAASLLALTALHTACLIGCAGTGPGALACVLACQGGYATLVAAETVAYNSAMNAAAATRNAAFIAADATYNTTVSAAAGARDNAVSDANQDYRACVAGCRGGLGGPGPGPFVEPVEP